MSETQTAVFGGGCFWCIEAVFKRVAGVSSVESGYMGGKTEDPTYRQVCNGGTGHVEVVRINYDPAVVSYRDLLDVFFAVHDPTTLNRQGNDVGEQYRSVVFYNSAEQKRETQAKIRELEVEEGGRHPIVTAVEPATTFYVAEDYHQNYYDNNTSQPYCQFIIVPKLKKLEEKLAQKVLSSQQSAVSQTKKLG
jgi:peptide-methionine (S)-S-oxide reductase